MRLLSVAAVRVLAAVVLSVACGCAAKARVSAERAIRETYGPLLDGKLDAVRCPPEDSSAESKPFDCQASALGFDFTVHVRRTSGGVSMEPAGILFRDKVAERLRSQIQQPDGSPAVVDCSGAAPAIAARADATFQCRTTTNGRANVIEVFLYGSNLDYGWDVFDPDPPARAQAAGYSIPVPPGWQLAEPTPHPAPAGSIELRSQRGHRGTKGRFDRIVVVPARLDQAMSPASPQSCVALAESTLPLLGADATFERSFVVDGPLGPVCQFDVAKPAEQQNVRLVMLVDGLDTWNVTCMAFGESPAPVDACRQVVDGWRREAAPPANAAPGAL